MDSYQRRSDVGEDKVPPWKQEGLRCQSHTTQTLHVGFTVLLGDLSTALEILQNICIGQGHSSRCSTPGYSKYRVVKEEYKDRS